MSISLNHIFFPTDFSKHAEQALPFAAEIANRAGAKLTLFHSSRESKSITSFEGAMEPQGEDSSQRLEDLKARLQEEEKYNNLEISTVLATGQPTTSLINHVNDLKPDLIVIGTKGATADRSVIFGSVTTYTINKTDVPVLAVPKDSTYNLFEKITFTTDFKEGDWGALQQTVDFAKIFDSSVDILHIAETPSLESEIKFRGFRELVTTQIDYQKVNFQLEYELDFFAGMAEYLRDQMTSLLVMVRYQKTFWEKLTERDHQKEMAFYSELPLLALSGDKNTKPKPVFDEAKNS